MTIGELVEFAKAHPAGMTGGWPVDWLSPERYTAGS